MENLKNKVKKAYGSLKNHFQEITQDAQQTIIPFAIFGLISHPVFYFMNLHLLAPQDYNNLTLRIIIILLCLTLALNNQWPKHMKSYLPLIWYGTLLLDIPIFVTFMTLKNHFSVAWTLNSLAFFILMMLLVDWISYTILICLGIPLGILLYTWTTPENLFYFTIDQKPAEPLDLIITYIVSLIMGIIFSRNTGLVTDQKIQAIKAVGASIAHELRTPLASIHNGISGAKTYLPKLIEGYALAKSKNLPVPSIRPDHYVILSDVLNEVEGEISCAHTIIDMLLLKVNLNTHQIYYAEHSIKHCVEEALARYSFNTVEQKKLVCCNITHDFKFYGEKLLMEHIIFNLLKNSLYFIAEMRKGKILIWTECTSKSSILYFKDTAKGMSPYIYANLFKKFFTNTRNGTGLGLSFCKTVMQKFGGEIICNTKEGEYTEFAFHFPRSSA
jgi:signal transduction histidine kinase